ncbi:MAG: cysteine ABC transporter permease [Anaerolineae bacterium SM23_ 63]|nr:MAG: cysteine ABC transporter permease [Anaerolineae bacterium SM23_ 63]
MRLDKRLIQQAWSARLHLALAIGFGALAGIILVGQALLISQIVAGVFLADKTLNDVQSQLLLLLFLSVTRAGLSWGSEVAAQRISGQVKHSLRQRLMKHLFTLGPAYTSGERSGELTNTVVEGVETLEAYFSQYLPQVAMAALVPFTILVFVLPLDLTSGLVLLFTAPLIPIFMILIGDAADRLTRRQWQSLSRMSAHFLDTLQGLTTLKLLGRSRDQVRAIAAISERFGHTTLGVLRVAFLSALVLEMVATLSTAVVAVEIGLRLLYGLLVFEQAFFVLILTPEFYLPLRMLGTRFHAGMSGIAAAERIFEILETPLPQMTRSAPHTTHHPQPRLDIHFQDVHYAYESGQRSALRGVSLHIPPGHKVAVVGPSGSGKTTIAHLLLRFIDPDQGSITVDGKPLDTLDMAIWRSQISWVPQNPYLFNASVEENIRLANPDATTEEVIHAAQQAFAHDFIQTLPQTYDTLIGERGSRLSGGQAQRITLARAFLKKAPFLILDEATANLDPEIEVQLREAMDRLLQDRTALIIAHRLGVVQDADTILVLAGGRVIESGSHAALLENAGLYSKLFAAYGGAA